MPLSPPVALAVRLCLESGSVTGLGAAASGVTAVQGHRARLHKEMSPASSDTCTSHNCPVPLPPAPTGQRGEGRGPCLRPGVLPPPQVLFCPGSSSSQTTSLMGGGNSPGPWEQDRGRRELRVPGKRHCLWMLPFSHGLYTPEMGTAVPPSCLGVFAAQLYPFALQNLLCPSLPSHRLHNFFTALGARERPQQREASPFVFNAPVAGAG